METYKTIQGYEHYMVSNYGNVFSLKRNKKLKPGANTCGYFYVVLSEKGKKKNFCIHSLVVNSFLKKIVNKNEVNHIDGIKSNNNCDNLEYVNRYENAMHSYHELGNHNLKREPIKIKSLDFGFTAVSINQMGKILHHMGILLNPKSIATETNRKMNKGISEFKHNGLSFKVIV